MVLQGGIELIKSSETGSFYATAKKATITCTFDERMCWQLIGSKLPGKIDKVPCDPYEFAVPGTEEAVTLSHTYRYDAEMKTAEEEVYSEQKVEA